ncbi:MAG: hypothetical protein QGH74_09625, partial [Candidatus Brocadiia bacterium]|nr:hypothetical protein [Candidatus Brocadiia bacterium]
PFAWGWNLFGTAKVPWTPVFTGPLGTIQLVFLLGGLIFSAHIGLKLARQTFSNEAAARRGFIPLLAFLTLVTLFFGWLYGGP